MKKQRLWKQFLKAKVTNTYTEFRKTSNQLRHLKRKPIKGKERNFSDQAKTNPNFLSKYVNKLPNESNTEQDLFDPITANSSISVALSENSVLKELQI